MSGHDIVVVGASSGGVEALSRLVGGLPADFPAAVFVVIHLSSEAPSVLPRILERAGPLEAVRPKDGDPIRPGRIYVASPDLHLLVERGRVRLTRGPKENRHRPAVDPLFRTAGVACGPRAVGVILTGAGNDGTAGLRAIKERGGLTVVQDPDEALFSGMPESALEYASVDYCLPLDKVAPLLVRLAREPAREEGAYPVPEEMEYESKMAKLDPEMGDREPPGELSAFTCPECTGPLYELRSDEFVRYRCRVGHAYTAESMLDEKSEELEDALYMALNTLEESTLISEKLAERSRAHDHPHAAARFEQRARDSRQRAEVIRRVLSGGDAAEAV